MCQTVVASERVSTNDRYHFTLAPGDCVLPARFLSPGNVVPWTSVKVQGRPDRAAGRAQHVHVAVTQGDARLAQTAVWPHRRVTQSGLPEDVVSSNSPPDDVRLARPDRTTVFEGGAPVRAPGHLPDPLVSFDSLHAQWGVELARTEVTDELLECGAPLAALLP